MFLLVRRLSPHSIRPKRCRLNHSSPQHTPSADLPSLEDWRNVFPYAIPQLRDRVSVKNPKTAGKLAKSFVHYDWDQIDKKGTAELDLKDGTDEDEEVREVRRGKVVIEAFPGPGALTRALMQLPEKYIRRIIVLEDQEVYLKYLRPLEALDPRVKVISTSGHDWETYRAIEEQGLLDDVKKTPWNEVQHDLQFISHIPTSGMGEQLVAQFFRCVPDQQWLFKYGRVPMSLVLGEWMWKRVSAPIGTVERCKVSVIADAVSAFAHSVPPSALAPYSEHFHPLSLRGPNQGRPEGRRQGAPLISVNVLPHATQVIKTGYMDQWDYCLRRLFVLKSTPAKKALSSLAPGASSLVKTLTNKDLPEEERLDVTKAINKLTVREWALIMKAFDEWPFAPEDLMISTAFYRDNESGKRI